METFIKVYFELEEGENLRLGLLAVACVVWSDAQAGRLMVGSH